ncbi:mRNA decapping enzyme DcpS N-terminal [Glarea lozoyensis ATCC 20868]|uniref:mRNA decapping enzyme DcpS N-terminal n=1 Tax=Glarea lozoyensis (strain ATCC 20868 / MF5171) TaxID=1116229 RepID=S3DTI9_GLAL2|nr:mRNA decapping enzyme DcpS N-terminal [Glarea lozoyensis ATCC 20868]EPE35251.1 mRNA decapping enzyme DcpS N-terminal [Glarea lozoyensis ATCC 20868]
MDSMDSKTDLRKPDWLDAFKPATSTSILKMEPDEMSPRDILLQIPPRGHVSKAKSVPMIDQKTFDQFQNQIPGSFQHQNTQSLGSNFHRSYQPGSPHLPQNSQGAFHAERMVLEGSVGRPTNRTHQQPPYIKEESDWNKSEKSGPEDDRVWEFKSQLERNPFASQELRQGPSPLIAGFHRPVTAPPLPLHPPPIFLSTPPTSTCPAAYAGFRHLNFPAGFNPPNYNMDGEVSNPESLIPNFKFEKVLNQDQAGRRISLYGSINSQPGILILERSPFPSSQAYLSHIPRILSSIQNLGANDIYFWYLASSRPNSNNSQDGSREAVGDEGMQDLKVNLIYPCTAQHIKKYSSQGARLVCETAEIYRSKVRPYMENKRAEGRLNWVYNIIEGKTEVEDVIFRTPLGSAGDEGFLLIPDLNWDRKTIPSLHLLGLVERRDIWSLRDLKKKHIRWLNEMRELLLDSTVNQRTTISTSTSSMSHWKLAQLKPPEKQSDWKASSKP